LESHFPEDEATPEALSPVVRGNRAAFHYRGEAQSVSFTGDSTGWRPIPMERDGAGWSLTRTYPLAARDEYMFVVDGRYILDPLNPLRGPSPFGPHSSCPMPDHHLRPVELPLDGKMERRTLASRVVDMYVPAQVEGAALLVVQDGYEYAWFTGLPGLLDGLIREGAIQPAVAVFVAPVQREKEYQCDERYLTWLADELVPAVEELYPVAREPGARGLIGCSLGGLMATFGALRRPDVFRLVGAQSPAYRSHITELIGEAGEIDWPSLRIHADAGTFEMTLYGRDFLPSIREGIDLLKRQGCAVQYVESPEGHNWTNWRGRLPELLTWLLG
jgi:enterochelin esterase-like enzyme